MTLSSRYSQPAIGFPRAPLKEFGKRKRVIAYLVDGGPEIALCYYPPSAILGNTHLEE